MRRPQSVYALAGQLGSEQHCGDTRKRTCLACILCQQSSMQPAAHLTDGVLLKAVCGTSGVPDADGLPEGQPSTNGNLLTGFENLEEFLSPETAAANKQAAAAAANGNGDDVAAPAAGVSLLGGLVTAKSKARQGQTPVIAAF